MKKLNLEEVEKIISRCPNYRIARWRKNRYSKFSDYIEIPNEFPDLPATVYNIRKKVAEKLKNNLLVKIPS